MGWEWGCWDDEIDSQWIIPEKSLRVLRTSQSIQALWSLWWKQETSTFAKTYGETQSIYPAYHV